MTCVASVIQGNRVFMGSDSVGASNHYISYRRHGKVFRNGSYLMGYTSSFRMGQLLQYNLEIPKRTEIDLMAHMVKTFIPAVRACLKDGGYATIKENAERGGCFLVAHQDSLFQINDDFQVAQEIGSYDAVGCGADIAKGSLYSTQNTEFSGKKRILLALEAAAHHSGWVAPPFTVMELKIK